MAFGMVQYRSFQIDHESALIRAPQELQDRIARLPDLLYEDFHWSDQKKKEWFDKTHLERHSELNFGVAFGDNILASKMLLIALAKPSRHANSPTVPVINARTVSTVFLYLKPYPQIGFRSQLLGTHYDLIKLGSSSNAPNYFDLSTFKGWFSPPKKVVGIDGLTENLNEMFREGSMFALASGKILWKMGLGDRHDVERFCAEDLPSIKKRKAIDENEEYIGEGLSILH